MFTSPLNPKMKTLTFIFSLLLILSPGSISSYPIKVDFRIDQSNTTIIDLNYRNFNGFAPMGQEFTPKHPILNTVELWIEDASCSIENPQGGQAQVRIRESTIDGPILGSSTDFSFPNCFNGIARFTFSTPVHMIPKHLYVIEAVYVSGDSALAADSEGGSTYSGGRVILNGVPDPEKDLWFQEGFTRPIRSST